MAAFKKVDELSPHLLSVDGEKARVEFSKVTGKWHYYVHDGARFMPVGAVTNQEDAIKAAKEALKSTKG
jgi:hypothetical protein